jgi:hypothetical protein
MRASGYERLALSFASSVMEVVVRTPSCSPMRALRALVIVSLGVVAAGCGGGSGSIPNSGSNGICDPNAGAITVARPTSGFPMNGNAVEIVASTNGDQLNQFPGQFDLILTDNFGGQIVTGGLAPVSDTGGPHPFTNDFYYAGTLQSNLLPGRTYNVFLNAPATNCTPGLVGQIFT